MIQGLDILKKLVNEQNLVENLCERELNNPENAGFDLRLGEVYELEGEGFIGIDERKTPETKLIAKYDPNKRSSIILKPGEYLIGKTIEKIKVPDNLFGILILRSTTWRCGINLVAGYLGPGYEGETIVPLTNLGKENIEIELGARVMHLFFIEIKGQTAKYKGQWQGGRVSTPETEKQI